MRLTRGTMDITAIGIITQMETLVILKATITIITEVITGGENSVIGGTILTKRTSMKLRMSTNLSLVNFSIMAKIRLSVIIQKDITSRTSNCSFSKLR